MKTALVTGANKSIGFETTRQLLKKGYFVYLGSRDLLKGQEAAEKLNKEGFSLRSLIICFNLLMIIVFPAITPQTFR